MSTAKFSSFWRFAKARQYQFKDGVRFADVGGLIEQEAKKRGFNVIKNLVGHGIGRQRHEAPKEIPCFYDCGNTQRFRQHVVETFISTRVHEQRDGWTMKAKYCSLVAQHEHTLVVTDGTPLILTASNGIGERAAVGLTSES